MGAMALVIPDRLSASCRQSAERSDWLARLPDAIRELRERWSLTIGAPFDSDEVSCAWVAPVALADGTPAVLKIGMPHMEAEHEIEGLRFWNGDPTVRLLDAEDNLGAMLLERCTPGTHLRTAPEAEQDVVIAGLLRRLWRSPTTLHSFRPLSVTLGWCVYGAVEGWAKDRGGDYSTTVRLLLESGETFEPSILPTGRDDVDAALRAHLSRPPALSA
jgi:streptomycin 6-kinase